MIRKKAGSSKKPQAPKKKTSSKKSGRKKTVQKRSKLSVFLLTLGIIIVSGALAYVLLHPSKSKLQALHDSIQVETKAPKNQKSRFEIYPVEPNQANAASKRTEETPVHRRPSAADELPLVAIIIDDVGYDRNLAGKFMNLDAVLTYSILPYSRFSVEIAKVVEKKGYEVMLHLPMEPNEQDIDPGKGKLLSSMTPDERISQLESDLDAVPYIKGVNNHMGSKLTTLSDEMNQIFSVLKKRDLFFIDSRTTAATQTRSSAKLFKVPFAQRDVFLDHVQSRGAIENQIEQLIHVAEITGKAIGIGHPHESTYEVLAYSLPELKKRVKLVAASEIVEQM